MFPLDDGVYDVVVVDARHDDEDAVLVLDLVLAAGPHKGEVVGLRMSNSEADALALLGLPGTLTVVDGAPRFDTD